MDAIIELNKEIEALRKRQVTHEIATGMILIEMLRAIEATNPGITAVLKNRNDLALDLLPSSSVSEEPHTEEALRVIDKIFKVAMNKKIALDTNNN